MRALRLLLAAALASAWPSQATAAVAQTVRVVPVSGMPAVTAPMPVLSLSAGAPSLLAPSLPAPSLPVLPLAAAPLAALTPISASPARAAAPAAAAVPAPTAHERLSSAAEAVAQARASVAPISSESAASDSERQFRLLLGETAANPRTAAYADGPVLPRPATALSPASKAKKPQDPEVAKRVRGMFAGTAAMKIGMETVTLSIPLLALATMGGATLVAGLMIVYGLAQAAFAGAAASLLDRLPAQKVLAGAVASQAVLVASIVALGALGLLTPLTLLPLYTLVGGAMGIAETSRHSIPPLILGHDAEALERYNARLHIFYEVAGVTGALATGALLTLVGPLWALALQPPAYLLGGFLFLRVKLARKASREEALKARFAKPTLSDLRDRIADYLRDLKAGARLVMGNDRLRWVAAAFVLPQIVHRILEGLLAPIFAKRVLENPGAAGYLMTASNMGELLGAVLLLRYAAKIKAPRWVKWGAMAMVASWLMAFSHILPLVLPVFLLMSMTWAASDLSLRSEVQSTLDEKDQPRATSFLFSAFVLGASAVSLGLGALFDLLPITYALAGVFALFTAVAAAVFHASRRLAALKP